MPLRAIFLIHDTESIISRMQALCEDLQGDFECLLVVRFPETARRFRALGFPALLVSDLLNWEHMYLFTGRPPQGASGCLTDCNIDLAEATRFESRLAAVKNDRELASRARRQAAVIGPRFLSFARFWQPQLVFVWNGFPLPYSLPRLLAKACGAFCLSAERGLIPDTLVMDTEGVNAASYLCGPKWDDIAARQLDDDLRAIVASCRAQYAANRKSVVSAEATGDPAAPALPDLPANKKLILCPAQLDEDTNPVLFAPGFPTNEDVLHTLLAAADPADSHILFKAHPEDNKFISQYQELLGARGTALPKETPLHALLEAAHIVVTRNSTVGFEGLLLGKPVVTLGRSLYSHKGFTHDATDTPSLARALQEASRAGLAGETQALFERFLAYLLTRYHYYTNPDTAWKQQANRTKREFILNAARAAAPRWGEEKAGARTLWPRWLAVEDDRAQLTRRLLLRAEEKGVTEPQKILCVKACPADALNNLITRLAEDLPDSEIGLAQKEPEPLPAKVAARAHNTYVLTRPLEAARLALKRWDIALFAVLNVSHPPAAIRPLSRLVRARAKFVVDDYGRILEI